MILIIHDEKTLEEVQERFNMCFPLLKIEFYEEPHKWQAESATQHLIDNTKRIGDIRNKHTNGFIEIKSWDKTGVVENLFKEIYDLNVQIFRFQNNAWIQTTYSDVFTLKEQTELAEGAKSFAR